jgi:hypothetical protein
MSAERFYVFTPGKPGYISAEVAVRMLPTDRPGEALAWAEDSWSHPGLPSRIISRSEAFMVPLYRDALDRWEARDDSILQATEITEIRASRRSTVACDAELGCSVAAAALEADDDAAIAAVISEHVHEGCGGRYFPDEPRTPPLVASAR